MKSYKKYFIILFSIWLSFTLYNIILSLYSSDKGNISPTFPSIASMEDTFHTKIHNFYDIEEFIINGKEIPLKSTSKEFKVTLNKVQQQETWYNIEIINETSTYLYKTISFYHTNENDKSVMMTKVGNGTLYQENYENQDAIVNSYYFEYVTQDYSYSIQFLCNDTKKSTIDKRIVDYINLVEEIN